MKVLVTGGAGFIGSHVVDALRERQVEVVVVDSLDPGVHRAPPAYLRGDVDYQFADLRYWRPDAAALECTAIVHLAALGGVGRAAAERENVLGANAWGTARLSEIAQGMPRLRTVVHASSFSVYGAGYRYRCVGCGATRDGTREEAALARGEFEVRCAACGGATRILPITEAAPCDPLEPYGASKLMQELCWRGFAAAPVHVMRFSSVYGPRLRTTDGEATIIAKLIGWIDLGRRPQLYEDGQQLRDWVHVSDVVDTTLALLEAPPPGRLVNVCSGVPTSLQSACEVIAEMLGRDTMPEVVGGYRAGDMRHCLGDASTMQALLGRAPVSLREGMRRTLAAAARPTLSIA